MSQDDDEIDSEGSEDSKNRQEFKSDPELKVMKYEYKSEYVKVKDFSITKFRSGNNPTKENVVLSLEKN